MNKSTGNYTVSLLGAFGPPTLVGSFSDASAIFLTRQNVQKITSAHTVNDVTLKRGVVDSSSLWNWLSQVRHTGVVSQRDVVITRRDNASHPIQAWRLHNARPTKYTGPPLSGKGSDVAIEELVLSAEFIEIVPPR